MHKPTAFLNLQKHRLFCLICFFELLILCFFAFVQLSRPLFSKTFYGNEFSISESSFSDSSQFRLDGQTLEICGDQPLSAVISFPLPAGAFVVQVTYDSIETPDTPSLSLDDSAGYISFQLPSNPSAVRADTVKLTDNTGIAKSMVWLRPFAGANDFELVVNHTTGNLSIHSIQIDEYPLYRFVQIASLLLFFLVIDFLFLFFVPNQILNWSKEKKYVVLGLLAITVFSSFPFFLDFIKTDGHDLTFHLNRIAALADSIKSGNIPQRIQTEMANGYGYATPLFYGELFLFIPAILHVFGIPLQTCYQIFGILVNFFTCLICFFCFKKMTGDWQKALFGSALYTLSSYRLMDVHVRASVGEYLAILFFPLLLYGFFSLYQKEASRPFKLPEYLPIIIGLTGIVQSHILSCEMVAIFISLFVVIFFKKTLQKHRFIALVKCVIGVILLNLWFLVPFLQSMQMDLNVTASNSINNLENSSLYIPQLFGVFHTSQGGSIPGVLHEMPLSIGFSFVIAIAVFLLYCVQRQDFNHVDRAFRPIAILFVFGIGALILSLNFIPWGNLLNINKGLAKFVGMVQFPWRYIALAATFLTFMITLLLTEIQKNISARYVKAVMLSILSCILISEGFFFYDFLNEASEHTFYTKTSLSTMDLGAGEEYVLTGTNISKATINNIIASDTVTIHSFGKEDGNFVFSCTNTSDQPAHADIPIFAYQNYVSYLSNGEITDCSLGENNRIRVLIPPHYTGEITTTYQSPLLWNVCIVISLLSFFIILFMLLTRFRHFPLSQNANFKHTNQSHCPAAK